MFRHPVVDHCLTFLNDVPRNTWYRDHLKSQASGKTVFEAGCGSGILAAYALQSGATHYYGVDINKQRSRFTSDVLDQLGYHHKHTVWCADASRITKDDVPQDIDLVLCEQTGHQMQNNFTIRDFYQNLSTLFPRAVFLPDSWTLDVYVYEGLHDSPLKEYGPQILLDDPSLPNGYKNTLDSFDFIQPSEILHDVLQLTPENCHEPLRFSVDLKSYGAVTLILVDHIRFKGNRCITQSLLSDCPVPVKILIPQAKKLMHFEWDPSQRREKFHRGFWVATHE